MEIVDVIDVEFMEDSNLKVVVEPHVPLLT